MLEVIDGFINTVLLLFMKYVKYYLASSLLLLKQLFSYYKTKLPGNKLT